MKAVDRELPTIETLQNLLSYDPETGIFLWKIRPGKRVRAGSVAGHYRKKSGHLIGINKTQYTAQLLAWKYMGLPNPTGVIVHKNGDNSDNRLANLMEVSLKEAVQRNSIPRHNSTGMKGVHRDGDGYVVRIEAQGKNHYGGKFQCLDTAKKAASALRKRLHGEHARDK